MVEKKKILITSALPYVNNVPHLGNIIGCVLSADVFARFCRSYGHDCIYICGTDEHGTATETKAIEEGVTPKEICDTYYKIHKDIYDWFGIGFDAFGRTSTEEQKELTQDIFLKLNENGYIIEKEVEQLYCKKCDQFLADRFVEGTCPKCEFDDARGDQCDGCGTLLNANELINPRCKICNSSPEIKNSKHLFIDLPKIEPLLKEWIDLKSVNWSTNAKTISYAWLKEGLKQRAITRDLKWGVPVPYEGFEDKVFYVWFDAPIGYLSITKKAIGERWKEWWQNDYNVDNPSGVKLYQFMGKDNVPFHTVIFPSSLLGSGDPYTMLYRISSTEYLNYEDSKFSKSRGIGVFGTDVKDTGIPADVFRYYLLRNRPERSDSTFTWDDLLEKTNNELVANFGNLVNRTITFVKKFFDKCVPKAELIDCDNEFIELIRCEEKKVTELLEQVELKEALNQIMHICRISNQYFQEQEPWKMIKEDKDRAGTVLNVLVQVVKDLAIMIEPYTPSLSEKIFYELNLEKKGWSDLGNLSVLEGHMINEPAILVNKLEKSQIDTLKKKFSGKNDLDDAFENESDVKSGTNNHVFPVALKTAKIIDVKDHPDADKLFVMQVDLSDEKRQLVAGLRQYYNSKDLIGKRVVIVSNLKPAKLRGFESQGMILAAEKDGVVEVIDSSDLDLGLVLCPEGMNVKDEMITIDTFAKYKMKTKEGFLVYEGKRIGSNGLFAKSNIGDNANVR